MPEIIAIRCGGICSWKNACWIELRIPKSPQPGHQSTWTSVLYSCRLNFLGGVIVSGMRNHDLLRSFRQRLTDSIDDLVPRERPAVVFQDPMIERDAGLLPDECAQLPGVVRFDQHGALGVAKHGFDLLGREWPHQAHLEKIHRETFQPELGHPIQDCALRGAPADQGPGRQRSAQLKLSKLSTNASSMSPEAITICGKSPWAGCRANCRSACSVRVGSPVEGPPRCQRKTTGPGASVIAANPNPSDIRAKPGPA